MHAFDHSRRQVLKGGAAAVAVGAIGSFGALSARQALAAGDPTRTLPIPSPYGALAPVADRSTGLPLLQLPRGFSYRSFGWSGDLMDNGQPCPDRHDGTAVVGIRRHGHKQHGRRHGPHHGPELVLIRNHERGGATPIDAPGMYDRGDIGGGLVAGGGTTTLGYSARGWESLEPSLGGTLVNCAGGPTPWGTWLSCEEIKTDAVSSTGHRHGYVFEVHPDAERTSGQPLVGLGRFSHEAVAIDPHTGIVYLTEDDRNKAGLYRFIPNDRRGRHGSLQNGAGCRRRARAGSPMPI